ncbi:hypothetical protein Scep_029436 [Stephania cephalantha]|uniref:Uncharacterized protein n=1 Tax=Stephania cephalantha TaxID=152367 RepID=A0AAP0HHL7_9MAGN
MRISEIAYPNPSVQTLNQSRSSIVLKSPNQTKSKLINHRENFNKVKMIQIHKHLQ